MTETKTIKAGGMNRRRFVQTAGIATGAAALSSTLPMRVIAKPNAIPLGQIAPMTGSAAEFGPFYRDGAKLGMMHINQAAKEVFGGPIFSKHIAEDTNTLPTPAIESARKLVEADGVPAYVGAWSSGVTVATATSVAIPNNVLQISNGSTSPLISVLPEDQEADLLFRTTSSDALQGVVAAQLAAGEILDDYKHKTAATIYVNNPYGQGLSNAFARSFQMRGGTVHAQIPHPEEVQATYSSQLAVALKDDPDVLVCCSYPGHTSTFLREARDTFGMTSWQFVDGNKSSKVLESVGADVLKGQLGTAPGSNPENDVTKAFAEQFKGEFGHDRVPPFTTSAYDAAVAIGLAAARALAQGEKDLTGPVLRDNLRPVSNPPGATVRGADVDSLAQGMEMLRKGEDIDLAGAAGSVDFDDNGDVKTPIEVWKFTEDGTETVGVQAAGDIPSE
ncbi:Tat (twin-arginine translocation) pathway signal sequence [Limimonas halophila]|uniref:Tat (Twin-arginine translocation) pathway signal sequence n=1 Tax=Limimonas halophila TaxID=1082479 RepID=A0A1G7UCM6_9PROT|nr:ABC transporter substrate-binding protein [Limimonas halophila]SDG45041.1 Tat (twin-arginine translocation) pathway signal sequence [Limimonas halophila]